MILYECKSRNTLSFLKACEKKSQNIQKAPINNLTIKPDYAIWKKKKKKTGGVVDSPNIWIIPSPATIEGQVL